MVELEFQVWGFRERDVVPSQMYVVAAKIGGQVLGAFVDEKMAGFVLAYAGIRDGRPYLHSHMAAVLLNFAILGIGRRLKLAQREDALARGISLIEWTFDPLQTKNAYFNICRLGAVARRYLLDVYGSTSSPLHAGLPTDRLVAEWHLESQRVVDILARQRTVRRVSVSSVCELSWTRRRLTVWLKSRQPHASSFKNYSPQGIWSLGLSGRPGEVPTFWRD